MKRLLIICCCVVIALCSVGVGCTSKSETLYDNDSASKGSAESSSYESSESETENQSITGMWVSFDFDHGQMLFLRIYDDGGMSNNGADWRWAYDTYHDAPAISTCLRESNNLSPLWTYDLSGDSLTLVTISESSSSGETRIYYRESSNQAKENFSAIKGQLSEYDLDKYHQAGGEME